MKKILGLDLGTTSIGWAMVRESENKNERSSIEKLGVRVNPLTVDELQNFEKGKSITSNADRTLKRSMRRNLQRYKLRRENLIEILIEKNIITKENILSETGNHSTFKTYESRAKAASEKIELEDFAKVLLMINKKRGYKSSRKAKNPEEGQLIDGMEIAKQLYENNITPGQFVYELLKKGKKLIPDFYRSDLQNELNKIWSFQKQFHNEILSDDFKKNLENKGKKVTTQIFFAKYQIDTIENKGNRDEKKLNLYKLRSFALNTELSKEELATVISEVNSDLNSSSGYLGAISDRSKELYFNEITVGQYLNKQIAENSNVRLKGQVFYRQDYLDEFHVIWEEQAKHHSVLNPELKNEIRDIIIFYQRKLKSQKGLISFCEFESKKVEFVIDGKKKIKTIGTKVCPKSSPLFQEFKIWQILNNIEVSHKKIKEKRTLELEEKQRLFNELSINEKLSKNAVLKLLFAKPTELDLNFKENTEGNRTNASLFEAYKKIAIISGHEIDFSSMNEDETISSLKGIFDTLGINTSILKFDSSLEGKDFENQDQYRLWHLLYSYEEDNSATGNERLISLLKSKFGFEKEYAQILSNVIFQDDYSSLSSKAIKKILPHLKDGVRYDEACVLAEYSHSKSLTKEQKEQRELKAKMEILPKNSLRNPVVEKILNQMINVVNTAIDEFGKPDEIRIELARELKKSAKEREQLTKSINSAKDDHEKFRKILQNEFNLTYVSRNDIIRYKLYKELETRGYKTLYSNTYISPDNLFSKEFDIEHIIPQSRLFDDSFSNKTLELRSINIEKSNETSYDYVKQKFGDESLSTFESNVEELFENGKISKTKRNKLLMKGSAIPEDFINRDLGNTQYIAKKAKEMLEEVFREVTTTTGSITSRLREDWQLVDVLQELNWKKYEALGLTYYDSNREGKQLPRIKDWTKRNDHRHHAMDALTVAFTKRNHVQYLNNLNARSDKSGSIYGIEQKELYRDDKNKLRFLPPIPLNDFRNEAKKHLENTLISFKAKNKVTTQNKNKFKSSKGEQTKIELTPRGQLHLETVYGSIKQYATEVVKVGGSFNIETINKVSKKHYRNALLKRLQEFNNDPKKAFTAKNSLDKNPLFVDEMQLYKVPEKVKLVWQETVYTIRKEINPDLKIDKVIDPKIKLILEARLKEFKNDPKKAFINLDENPIWLNKEKGINIRRVTISGVSNVIALHDKKDKDGKIMLDEKGNTIPVDFVNTGNNHHVAIYRDEKGNLQDDIQTFYAGVERSHQKISIINKNLNEWKFLFSIKQNEYFIFPNILTGFNPNEIDILDNENYQLISPNLYRVQKISKLIYGNSAVRDYVFRHHLETTLTDTKELKDITFKNIKSLQYLENVVKVRINHLGKIVQVGEY